MFWDGGGNSPAWWNPFTWDWEAIGRGIVSAIAVAGGVALCFVPGAQAVGAGLIIFGAGVFIGGAVGAYNGSGFSAGWDVGSLIGGVIGLAIAAPQLLSMTAKFTIPTFGWMATSTGALAFGVTSTAVISIPIGGIATSAAMLGLVLLAEHTSNKRPSSRNKHEAGQARRKRDQGGEKGDLRRPYKKWKRGGNIVFLNFGLEWVIQWMYDNFYQ